MISNLSHLIYIVLSPIISTIFAFLNGLSIFVFLKRFRLSSLTVIVIINICLCDIFVCIVSNTFYLANLLHPLHNWTTGTTGCKLFKSLTMLTNIAQIFLLCILSADRLRRLLDFAKRQWTSNDARWMVFASWSVAALLTLPRVFLFEEQSFVFPTSTDFNKENATGIPIVILNCKPILSNWYAGLTIVTFIVGYFLPTCFILFTLVKARFFMWKRRNSIHISCNKNTVTKMNNTLSLTFTLTATLFVAVWTPFFLLSLLDLRDNFIYQKEMKDVNFTLRCTLLIFGSMKPIIYLICLEKFRKSFCMKYEDVNEVETSSGIRKIKVRSSSGSCTQSNMMFTDTKTPSISKISFNEKNPIETFA